MRPLLSSLRGWTRRTADTRPDVAIVSYPKSGNTWVRFLIANLLRHTDEVVDFHSVQRYVPEVGRHDAEIARLPRPRIVKSHGRDLDVARRVIYVVRDGRDVYVSYYFHEQGRLSSGTTFGAYLASRDPASLWSGHVSAWLYAAAPRPDVLVVRYEDLVTACATHLRRMADFIGLRAADEAIAVAVRASSFARMRELEVTSGRPYRAEGPDVFVRRGEPGNWREHFGPDEVALFKAREGDVLIRLGYEADGRWEAAVTA